MKYQQLNSVYTFCAVAASPKVGEKSTYSSEALIQAGREGVASLSSASHFGTAY